jgi:hypothetical protein
VRPKSSASQSAHVSRPRWRSWRPASSCSCEPSRAHARGGRTRPRPCPRRASCPRARGAVRGAARAFTSAQNLCPRTPACSEVHHRHRHRTRSVRPTFLSVILSPRVRRLLSPAGTGTRVHRRTDFRRRAQPSSYRSETWAIVESSSGGAGLGHRDLPFIRPRRARAQAPAPDRSRLLTKQREFERACTASPSAGRVGNVSRGNRAERKNLSGLRSGGSAPARGNRPPLQGRLRLSTGEPASPQAARLGCNCPPGGR